MTSAIVIFQYWFTDFDPLEGGMTKMEAAISAANRGCTTSQCNLGVIYSLGLGVQADYVQAFVWWDIAARHGHASSARYRDNLAKKMDRIEVEKARKLSRRWKIAA